MARFSVRAGLRRDDGRVRWFVPLTLAFLLVSAGVALAAELVTSAEVESGTPNVVTVPQGGLTQFDIKLSATGALKCIATAANPATARVHTSYSFDAAGDLTSGALSAAFNFFAGSQIGQSDNCNITWTGAPVPYVQVATVSAHADTPVGSYEIVLSAAAGTTVVTTPTGSGGDLDDKTATTVTVHVVAAEAGYTLDGFYQPVQSDMLNTAKAGRTIPLKFNILDADEVKQDDIGLVEVFVMRTACNGGDEHNLLDDDTLSSGRTELRWDPDGEQMIFNWKTPRTPGCYRIVLEVAGDSISADFELR